MAVYALTIFTGAFLLFLVQPLIGKYILPWFGGAPAVWTTCLLFFQVLLLCGYAYAHFSARWLKPRVQAIAHLVLLAAALALLPITPADSWKPTDAADPTLRILGLLLVSIGLPYLVLAATSPLMQHWFSRTHPGVSPFRLYALSNLGSMLALLSFPVYFETQFTRTWQARLWGWGLVVYAVSCALCAIKLWRTTPDESRVTRDERLKPKSPKSEIRNPKSESLNPQPSTLNRILWLLLPACASTLLLATTNMICQEVAVIPFLWILPLSLYLLSFIICFDSPRWYVRLPFALAFMVALASIAWVLFQENSASLYLQIGVFAAGLFICCMVCHGELYRLRPDPSRLTGYYLMLAAGGALGGIFVAIVAPLIFTNYYELQLGLLLCGALFIVVVARDREPVDTRPKRKPAANLQRYRRPALIGFAAGLAALAVVFWLQAHKFASARVVKTRNFYGVLTVFKYDNAASDMHYVQLSHGRTMHGMQFTDPVRALWPTAYFSENSGIGLAMRTLPAGQRRIGVIGLGAGTLAAYPQAGDDLRFYEINPEVERIANTNFTYLAHCRGKASVILGDARLSLEREPPQNFDLFVIDAFNSDAIPVHLLTEEAFKIYERHLKTNGVIAVHISNKRIDLEPVLANVARHFGYRMITVEHKPPQEKPWIQGSSWVLLSHNEAVLNSHDIRLAGRPLLLDPSRIPLWTDDFSSLYQILSGGPITQQDDAFTDAECAAAFSLFQQGDCAGAIARFRSALKSQPRSPTLLGDLAFLLASCPDMALRNLPEATRMAENSCQLTHYRIPAFLSTLAVIYSETGRFDDAIWMAEKAVALASETGEQPLVQKNQELLELYRAHKPFHELTSPPPAETSATVAPASGSTEKLVPPAP
ncbi:MAG TPA: fused MFS/spermidine synthase [Candidatus Acidoferrum sp.]|nr:fused MFS/spermidine synthase [Candidatus Acidoferrum sp.]